MLKNILNVEGVQKLSKNGLKSINGGSLINREHSENAEEIDNWQDCVLAGHTWTNLGCRYNEEVDNSDHNVL